jgi:hypothetical protein
MSFIVAGGALLLGLLAGILLDDSGRRPKARPDVPFDAWWPQTPCRRVTDVDHQTEGAELVFLSFAIALTQFFAFAMEHHTGELVATFAAIELHQDTSPLIVTASFSTWTVTARSP